MESIMEQIRTRLEGGETPQELIGKGFKRTTVYSVAKKIKPQTLKDGDTQSLDRDIYLALMLRAAFFQLMLFVVDTDSLDHSKEWDDAQNMADEWFEEDTGRKPPKDFLTARKLK